MATPATITAASSPSSTRPGPCGARRLPCGASRTRGCCRSPRPGSQVMRLKPPPPVDLVADEPEHADNGPRRRAGQVHRRPQTVIPRGVPMPFPGAGDRALDVLPAAPAVRHDGAAAGVGVLVADRDRLMGRLGFAGAGLAAARLGRDGLGGTQRHYLAAHPFRALVRAFGWFG